MGPAILARADVGPFAAKIHGSALEYTVKPHPALPALRRRGDGGRLRRPRRLPPHGRVALGGAAGCRRACEEKTRLGPARRRHRGVPPAAGRDREAAGRLRRQADRLQGGRSAARRLAAGQGRAPRMRGCEVAGFGEYEDGLRRLLAALDRGDLDDAREVARLGWALEGGEEKPLPILSAFLADPPPGYARGGARAPPARSSSSAGSSTTRSPSCCPRAEALVMPSTFPEAFGMVAAEAAACGALPVSAGHSGMLEVSRQLAADAARGGRPADLVPGRGGRGRGDRRPARRLAGAARGRARGGPRGAGRDARPALELGGRGPRSARRLGRASLTVCRSA